MQALQLSPWLVAFAAPLLVSRSDVRSFRIANAWCLSLLVSGLVYHAFFGGASGVISSVLGILFGGFILLPLHLRGGIGGGDVKLLAGIGAWLGIPGVINAFIATGIATGMYAIIVVLWHGEPIRCSRLYRPLAATERVAALVKQPGSRRSLIPMAPLMAFGVLAAAVWTSMTTGIPVP